MEASRPSGAEPASAPFTNTPAALAARVAQALASAPMVAQAGERVDVFVVWAGQKAARHESSVPLAEVAGRFGNEADWYEARRQPRPVVVRHRRNQPDVALELDAEHPDRWEAAILQWTATPELPSPIRYRPTGIDS